MAGDAHPRSGVALPDRPEGGPRNAREQHRSFRAEIQGMRALGLMLVFVAHADLAFGEGGFVALDTFFVMSGFLITGLLLKEIERTGTLSISAFYGRRVRRLLPLAVVVLVSVLIASWVLYSPVQSDRVSGDVIAASLYVVNWHFAAQEVDYFAVDPADSPLQHFWSLSVEEQFYLVWPALLLLALVCVRSRGERAVRRALWTAVVAVGVPAFVYGVFLIDYTGHAAYFSTIPRAWEFAAGGALALALPRALALRPWVSALLTWGGLSTIVGGSLLLTEEMAYPGALALAPTLATIAVLVAGTATVQVAPIRLLSRPAMQYVGDLSYAWYLWHWPVLVFARAATGEDLTGLAGLGVIALSGIPTVISHHLIENPLRYSQALARVPRRALAFGAGCIVGAVSLAVGLTAVERRLPTAPQASVTGALAVINGDAGLQRSVSSLRPAPRAAKEDRGKLHEDGCLVPQTERSSPACVYGNPRSARTVVLFGNSHAMHWFPAVERVAKRRDWRLVALTRAGCAIADVRFAARCDAWREEALRRMEERERPRMVIVATSRSMSLGVVADGRRLSREESVAHLRRGLARTLRRLRAMGARVILIKDLPRSPHDVPDCVSRQPERLERCAFRREPRDDPAFDEQSTAAVDGAEAVDPAPVVCPGDLCPAVMGNALVYRDDNHFTATFAATLAPWLDGQLPHLAAGTPDQVAERADRRRI
ncbi:MAG TPA: acyltransferase family protein [Thermoleophilaceae bacterium]|nr:acyltransferase family protein [Thermoleophilaceae bacterium]